MKLGKMITGNANFSFDYFQNGGQISFDCIKCLSKIILNIEIYKSGKLVEQISDDFESSVLVELIKNKIVNLKNNENSWHLNLSKYILWNMNALYSISVCKKCKSTYISIFGMGELQPGREEVQFKGVWQILSR
jgi:hypothetical protein